MQNPFKLWQVSAGRTGRLDWMLGQLGWLAALMIAAVPLTISFVFLDKFNCPVIVRIMLLWGLLVLSGLVVLVGTVGVINLDIRRLHDMGLSGWFVLIPFVLGVIGKLAPQAEVVTSFIVLLFFLGLLLIPGHACALKVETPFFVPSPNQDTVLKQNEQPPLKVEEAKECDAKKGLCVAALVLVALIALGLAWAFRLQPIGKQELGVSYYRNRWTGTMYSQLGDRMETSAQREKRIDRERAEDDARKADAQAREALAKKHDAEHLRQEKGILQKENEEKAVAAAVKAEADWQNTAEMIQNGVLLYYRLNDGRRVTVPREEEQEFLNAVKADSKVATRVFLWQAGKYKERILLYTRDDGKNFDVPESLKADFLAEAARTQAKFWRLYEPREGESTLNYIGENQRSFTIAESDEKEFLKEAEERNCRVWKK